MHPFYHTVGIFLYTSYSFISIAYVGNHDVSAICRGVVYSTLSALLYTLGVGQAPGAVNKGRRKTQNNEFTLHELCKD